MQRPSRGHPTPLPAPTQSFTFRPAEDEDGIFSGSAGRHPPGAVELGKRQAGTRGCCYGCPARSCCDWPTGSSWRCCSSCRPGSRGSSLWRKPGILGINAAKTADDICSEPGTFRTPCKLNQGRHVPGQRFFGPLAFQKRLFIISKFSPSFPGSA